MATRTSSNRRSAALRLENGASTSSHTRTLNQNVDIRFGEQISIDQREHSDANGNPYVFAVSFDLWGGDVGVAPNVYITLEWQNGSGNREQQTAKFNIPVDRIDSIAALFARNFARAITAAERLRADADDPRHVLHPTA